MTIFVLSALAAGVLAGVGVLTVRLIARYRAEPDMSEADKAVWAEARSLARIGARTARWLTGELAGQPGYCGPVDVDENEAPGMTQVLIACNLAGFLTENSQAGADDPGYDGAGWRQVAAVDGLIGDIGLRTLRTVAAAAGLRVDASGTGRTVTWRAGHPYTRFGGRRDDLDDEWTGYGICHPDAVAELQAAHPVVVYDPVPGRNDRLWPALARFALAAGPAGRR